MFSFFVLLCFCFGNYAMAAGGGGDGSSRELDRTPTWAVAGVCTVIIVLSIIWEKGLHKLGTWLLDRHKKALYDAVEKVKDELMVLGFISLFLNFGQKYIVGICIPEKIADRMLPCSLHDNNDSPSHRRLLWYEHRHLAADSPLPACKEGHVPLISVNGLHQLHILIFFLAVFHLLYSAITMMLGRLKIRGWKIWEEETSTRDYEFSNDPSRFRLTHETSFVRAHTSFWTRIPIFFYVGCFSRQFFQSVSKSDYLTLRNGFISAHLAPGSKFNFQKYIKRSLEDDFKVVVGVSPVLWASFVVFLLFNVKGWQELFWASLVPVIIILLVGTKLQAILTKMAWEIKDRHAVIQGIPLVQGSNKYFWFGRPQLILHLIHFALFQNAFQITYFLWLWYCFGLKSCFQANLNLAILKVAIGVGVLFLCSYITLPLYALVTQMGSSMKKAIFDDQTAKALKKWRMGVKKRVGEGKSHRTSGESVTLSPVHSAAARTLQRFKTTGHSTRSSTYYNDQEDSSEIETEPLNSETSMRNLVAITVGNVEQRTETNAIIHEEEEEEAENNVDHFSFVNPTLQK